MTDSEVKATAINNRFTRRMDGHVNFLRQRPNNLVDTKIIHNKRPQLNYISTLLVLKCKLVEMHFFYFLDKFK